MLVACLCCCCRWDGDGSTTLARQGSYLQLISKKVVGLLELEDVASRKAHARLAAKQGGLENPRSGGMN